MEEVAALGLFELTVIFILLVLVLVYYQIYIAKISVPPLPLGIRDAIVGVLGAAGNFVLDVGETILSFAISVQAHAIRETIQYYIDNGYGIVDTIRAVLDVFAPIIVPPIVDGFHRIATTALAGEFGGINAALDGAYGAIGYVNRLAADTLGELRQEEQIVGSNIANILGALDNNIYPRLNSLEHDVGITIGQIETAFNFIRDFQARIASLESSAVYGLPSIINGFRTDIATLSSQVGVALQEAEGVLPRVGSLEGKLAELARELGLDTQALAKLAILGILTGLTVAEIENIARLARDPCFCFRVGGEFGWMAPVLAAEVLDSPIP